MLRVGVFVEDDGHERLITPLLDRIAREADIQIAVQLLSTRGGYGAVCRGLRGYARDQAAGGLAQHDVLIVAVDSNCVGAQKRRDDVLQRLPESLRSNIVLAIPEPHVERWYLADQSAFKAVFGKGCGLPKKKCLKDYYKNLLAHSVNEAAGFAPLGGIEYGPELVRCMDFEHMARIEESFAKFRSDIARAFRLAVHSRRSDT